MACAGLHGGAAAKKPNPLLYMETNSLHLPDAFAKFCVVILIESTNQKDESSSVQNPGIA